MVQSFDPGALAGHSFALPRGPRVRLRLAQVRDVGAVTELLGGDLSAVEVARIIKENPRRQIAVCATALIDLRETVVGFASMEVGGPHPAILAVDEALTDGLAELMTEALGNRSRAITERQAA